MTKRLENEKKKKIKKLIIHGSRWRKTDVLRNLISNKPDFKKIYLYVTDTYEGKCQL